MGDRVYGVVSVYDHAELLPHFLAHYQRLGVYQMHLSVRSEEARAQAEEHVRQTGFGQVHFTPADKFADSDKADVEEAILAAQGIDPDDYVMHLDLDEFQQYPAELSEIVRQMNLHNDWAIRGWVIDRIAADGTLQPVRPTPSIWEQFPVMADVTGGLLGAWTQKIVLCRRRVKLAGGVRHDTTNAYYDRVPVPGQYLVHHFKWLAGLDRRLEARLAKDALPPSYRAESERFLGHYRKHGKIDLTMPALRATSSPVDPLTLTKPKGTVLCYYTYGQQWPVDALKRHWTNRGYRFDVCGLWRRWEDMADILRRVRAADHVHIWHGSDIGGAFVKRLCQNEGKPFTVFEWGWLPQKDTWHLDPAGIIGESSLCGSLDWVTPEQIATYRSFRSKYLADRGLRWQGVEGGPVVVPLQIEHDAAVYWHAPHGLRTMADLVDHVCATYPDRDVIVCRHPGDQRPTLRKGRWTFATQPTIWQAQTAGLVVGLTSTVLLETTMMSVPTKALGNCPLRHHAGDEERLLAAYYARQIPRSAVDLTPWLTSG